MGVTLIVKLAGKQQNMARNETESVRKWISDKDSAKEKRSLKKIQCKIIISLSLHIYNNAVWEQAAMQAVARGPRPARRAGRGERGCGVPVTGTLTNWVSGRCWAS